MPEPILTTEQIAWLRRIATPTHGAIDWPRALDSHEALRAERDRARPTCATCRFVGQANTRNGVCVNAGSPFYQTAIVYALAHLGGCALHDAPQPSAEETR